MKTKSDIHQEKREKIQSDVEKFLAKNGKVEMIPNGMTGYNVKNSTYSYGHQKTRDVAGKFS